MQIMESNRQLKSVVKIYSQYAPDKTKLTRRHRYSSSVSAVRASHDTILRTDRKIDQVNLLGDPWALIDKQSDPEYETLQLQLAEEIKKTELLVQQQIGLHKIRLLAKGQTNLNKAVSTNREKLHQKKRSLEPKAVSKPKDKIISKVGKFEMPNRKPETYQGVFDLEQIVGLHQMSKQDRKFNEKRRDRILDIYEKDIIREQMKQEGYQKQR